MTQSSRAHHHALGNIGGLVVGVLYTMPVYTHTLGYFMAQIGVLLDRDHLVMWSYFWMVVVFFAIAGIVRWLVVSVMMLISHVVTFIFVRLSLPRSLRR